MVWKIVSLYGVIGYHVTLAEGRMIANHPIYGVIDYHVTLRGPHDSQSPHIRKHVYYLLFISSKAIFQQTVAHSAYL